MSDALDKANVALGAWNQLVEQFANEMYDCYEREDKAQESGGKTQTSEEAYRFAFHQIGSVLRRVAHYHNEAVRAIQAERGK